MKQTYSNIKSLSHSVKTQVEAAPCKTRHPDMTLPRLIYELPQIKCCPYCRRPMKAQNILRAISKGKSIENKTKATEILESVRYNRPKCIRDPLTKKQKRAIRRVLDSIPDEASW